MLAPASKTARKEDSKKKEKKTKKENSTKRSIKELFSTRTCVCLPQPSAQATALEEMGEKETFMDIEPPFVEKLDTVIRKPTIAQLASEKLLFDASFTFGKML